MIRKDYFKKKYQHPLKEPVEKKKLSKRSRGLVATSVAVFLLAGIIYILFFSPWLTIKKVQIKGSHSPEYSTMVNQWLAQRAGERVLRHIPGNNLFVLTTDKLKEMLETDNYISYVEVKKKLPDKLLVTIGERQPKLIYSYENKNYLIDEQGQVIEQVVDNKFNLPLILTTTSDEFLIPPDPLLIKWGLDSQQVNFISNLALELPKYITNINIVNFQLIPKTREILANTSGSWQIYFDTQADIAVQLSNLTRIFNEKISEEEKASLKYIDVRLENYVYYK